MIDFIKLCLCIKYLKLYLGKLLFITLVILSHATLGKETTSVFEFGKCIGHITICDDNFNEKISIKKKSNGTIVTTLTLNYPHVLEVSEGKVKINDKYFTSTHIIKNNLNNKFLMELEGRMDKLSKIKLNIFFDDEKLATINLKQYIK